MIETLMILSKHSCEKIGSNAYYPKGVFTAKVKK